MQPNVTQCITSHKYWHILAAYNFDQYSLLFLATSYNQTIEMMFLLNSEDNQTIILVGYNIDYITQSVFVIVYFTSSVS